ncbi:hypothetical protein [Planococcus beijingensis]|uniref:hypothetical protein n=1 Tax=Planococcus beijingensis TaxID=2782551 RepID=UPI00193C5778|nr:hypothetical protein [Planococcus beijingensis]
MNHFAIIFFCLFSAVFKAFIKGYFYKQSFSDDSKEDADELKGEEYIETAWNHWSSGGGFAVEDYEKNLTFIALRSIGDKQMEALELSREITELQKISGLMGGEVGMLSEEEKEAYHTGIEEKLHALYESIN